LGAPPP